MNSFKTAIEVAQITQRQERSMKFIDRANPNYAGGVWALVDVPVGQSRSGFLVEAARTAMHAR